MKEFTVGDYVVRSDDGEHYTISTDEGLWVGDGTLSHGCTADLGERQDEYYDRIDCWLDAFCEDSID